jgi:streptogramin lyase
VWLAAAGVAALACVAVALLATGGARAPTVFTVPGQPTGLTTDGGRIWVAGPAAGAVWVLDARSGEPVGSARSIDGTPAKLVLDRRFAWIADTSRAAILRLPREGRAPVTAFRAGADVSDLALAGGAVWTTSSADGSVHVLGERTLHAGRRPIALAAAGRRVVVLDAAGFLLRFDARTRRPEGRPLEIGGAPADVALAGDTAWVADPAAGIVRAVALGTGTGSAPIGVCRGPSAIAADAHGVYVICRDRSLVALDPSGKVRERTALAHVPTALALDARHVWIAAGSDEVLRVDR